MGVGLVCLFLFTVIQPQYRMDRDRYHGFGYSMAGIYPTTVSFAGNLIEKYPIAWSFILTIASIGSIVMPSIIGKIAETAGIFYGMGSIVVVVFIDMVCILALVRYLKKTKSIILYEGDFI